jgi:isocitrate/isopropylmalate dehydrogenase
MSSVMMLRWLKLPALGDRLEAAIYKVYADGRVRTPDLGGKATTQQVRRRDHRRHLGDAASSPLSALSPLAHATASLR